MQQTRYDSSQEGLCLVRIVTTRMRLNTLNSPRSRFADLFLNCCRLLCCLTKISLYIISRTAFDLNYMLKECNSIKRPSLLTVSVPAARFFAFHYFHYSSGKTQISHRVLNEIGF